MVLESLIACRVTAPAMSQPVRTAWTIYAAFCTTMLHISVGLAQTVAPITPSGLDTQVNLSTVQTSGKVQYDITGGTRAGTNLFHSFGDFNAPNNSIANFLNDSGLTTSNILGRVTGGNSSTILGTIQTTDFGNANLFLMNPAGIVFGPTATLNVGGSVTFTTADYLRLGNAGGPNTGIFYADPPQVSLLSSAPLVAFGFLGSNPGSIIAQGSQLTVPEKQGISLVGGNITIQNGTLDNGTTQPARLSAPNGQINLATVKSAGEFMHDLTSVPNISGASFRSFGAVNFAPGSIMDFSHPGNGKISIHNGQLVLEIQDAVIDTANDSVPTANSLGKDTIVFAPESSIFSQTFSADHGPDVRISADQITVLGVTASKENFFMKPFTGIQSDTDGTGKAGDIILRATEDIKTIGVVNLDSFTFARGDSGSLELTSTHGNIRMIKGGTEAQGSSQAMAMSSGNAGNLTASALEGDIELDGTSLFTLTNGSGKAGKVKVEAINLRMKAGILSSMSIGPGEDKPDGTSVILTGNLTMTSDSSLVLPDGFLPDSVIFTASLNKSPAADITIKAKDIVVTQKSIINSATFASGAGGNITIVADTLQVTDGAQLSSGSTKAPNRGQLLEILGGTSPTGHGGDITIQTLGPRGSVVIDGLGSGIFAETEGTGIGGNISLTAGKSISLNNGGAISASSTSPGDAGNITIDAGHELDLMGKSSITTEAKTASGGDIDIRAIDRVRLVDSSINTSVFGGDGNGGNITIDPNVVVLQGSQVKAEAFQGVGGDITITTPLFLADSTSEVSALSPFGLNGTVSIQSPTSNVSGSLGPLTSKPSQAQALLTQRCAALAGGQASSFVVAGREQLPADPGGWLTSSFAFAALGESHDAGHAVASVPAIMAIAAHDTGTVSLRRLTPPGFMMASFADSKATGCHS